MKTSEFLRAAKAVIDTPEKWTKLAAARYGPGGVSCHPAADNATCFCMTGATERAYWRSFDTLPNPQVRINALEVLQRAIKGMNMWTTTESFNDRPSTKHEQVMAVYDAAIAERDSQGD
jgi:hypothetical protein